MRREAAIKLVENTLHRRFDEKRYFEFTKNIFKRFNNTTHESIKSYSEHIRELELIASYRDEGNKHIDILIANVNQASIFERAGASLRDPIANFLRKAERDAALVAYVAPDSLDWRLSLVAINYYLGEQGKLLEQLTPAKSNTYLVGENENCHTAQEQFVPILESELNPTLNTITEIFNKEKITEEFYEKYRKLFLQLKENLDMIVSNNPKVRIEFTKKQINTQFFAKKLLGQIVFLYFLQKKGWLGVDRNEDWGSGSKHFLRDLFERKNVNQNFFNCILEPLLYEALRLERPGDYYGLFNCRIPFLNSGLFDPINNYCWWETEIILPDDLFSNNKNTEEGYIGSGIFDVFDRYNFTVKEDAPLDHEVGVDPEMLGNVFEKLLEKEDRESMGAYYTPREIVQYMCQDSLLNHLTIEFDALIPRQDIEQLIKSGIITPAIQNKASLIDEKLNNISICDPAVGSGAFLIGMMHEIINVRSRLTEYLDDDKHRTSYKLKFSTIRNCLYGVDIDQGAVEIARLRIWLSLIVDENDSKNIQPLPNLDYKIVQGNSLLGFEKFEINTPSLIQLEKIKSNYFDETSPSKKQKYREQIQHLLREITNDKNEFDFNVYFSEIIINKKGFDIVIANPPYIDSEEMTKSQKNLRDNIAKTYQLTKGNWDIYIAFYERGFKILNKNGSLAFISPDKWIVKSFGYELRKASLKKLYSILKSGRDVFKEAKVDSIITLFINKECSNLKTYSYENRKIIFKGEISKNLIHEPFTLDFVFSNYLFILKKIESCKGFLSDSFKCENACATSDAYKLKPLIEDLIESDFDRTKHLKIINTGTIGKYTSKWGKVKMTYLKSKYLFPVVDREKFLTEFNNSYSEKSVKQKIIIKGLTLLDVCLDAEGDVIPGKSTLMIANENLDNLMFLLALLNSKLILFYIREKYPAASYNQGINFTKEMINSIPIPIISNQDKNKLIELVKNISEISRENHYLNFNITTPDFCKLQDQIDRITYRLYNLTSAEIEIIENQTKRKSK
ncbi:TPA: DNA methyltransferase [Legionella pneumophila]|nr:N-6 DNA methylase [Legionella pneumophila]HAU1284664.1 N-6 DNA methylase [Legionella pneumophila]